jgi:hypothetical protein
MKILIKHFINLKKVKFVLYNFKILAKSYFIMEYHEFIVLKIKLKKHLTIIESLKSQELKTNNFNC